MTKKNQDFTMYAGDTKDIIVNVTDPAGAVVNISGASVKWVLKKTIRDQPQAYKATGNGVTLTNPTGGVFTVRMSKADTEGISGRYYHEAEVTDSLGNVSTVMTGSVQIEPSGV